MDRILTCDRGAELHPKPVELNAMTDRIVTVKLNQQQLEMLDRTIAQGVAADRAALVRFALRELAAQRAQTEARR
jgi:metal-responsive CopG/Arc/MetJ family transcriptional regulator